ncbi:hypothetical protein T492DRAFT_844953 [Pavlovales sp. CCMP2436]|nr:hypothetical protein T492DRAFT_844953 [Pavlovales sp. CCMP2436]
MASAIAKPPIFIDLEDDGFTADERGVINFDAGSGSDEPEAKRVTPPLPSVALKPLSKKPQHAAPGAGGSSTIDLSNLDDDDPTSLFAGVGLVIDISDDADLPGDHTIDLTADDSSLAKQIQRAFNTNAFDGIDLTAGDGADDFDLLLAYRNSLDNFLQDKIPGSNVREIYHNPHSQPGTPLYQRFYEAYKSSRDKTIKLVFHGTSEGNVENICRSSLDPTKRGQNGQALGKGEYFAEDIIISLPYCKGGRKMFVFAVIMDEAGLRKHNTPGILVCHRPDNQLPLAVITLDGHQAMLSALGAGMSVPAGLPPNMAQHLLSLMRPWMAAVPPPRPPPPPRAKPRGGGGGSKKKRKR